jgi:MYXO-CTERM domain-containing protein
VENPDACTAQGVTTSAPLINVDQVPQSTTVDDIEAPTTTWQPTGVDFEKIWSRTEPTPGNHVWHGLDFGSPSDTSLESIAVDVSPTGSFILSFDHRHQFEASGGTNWDGAVLEISTNGGGTWQDISVYGDPGYGGAIGDPMADNVLKGRQGYVGESAAWPSTDHVTVAMGNKLAGKQVKIRFRIGSDNAAGTYGWDLDNITFQGIVNKPFDEMIADATICSVTSSSSSSGGSEVTSSATGNPTTSSATGGVGGNPATTGSAGMTTGGAGSTGGAGGAGTGTEDTTFGGCGCFMGGSSSNPLFAAPLFLLSALLLRRRQQR